MINIDYTLKLGFDFNLTGLDKQKIYPIKQDTQNRKEPEFILTIANHKLNLIMNQFFGKDAKFKVRSHTLVETGQMAPKEVVAVRDKGNQNNYLVREFPFYIKGDRDFIFYNTRFQNWLSTKQLTPPLKRANNGGLFVELRNNDFLYLQEFQKSTNLAKDFPKEIHNFGTILFNFHKVTPEFLRNSNLMLAECMKKNAQQINEELFVWGTEAFRNSHSSSELDAYSKLVEFSKEDIKKYAIDERKYNIPKTIIHGDCNPGNVIKADESRNLSFIDFDDLRVDHPASDVAHALTQMMVLKFFDKSMNDRNIPNFLSNESKSLGKEFLQAYLKEQDKAYVDEIFARLKKEIPLAIHRGVLLGFLNFKIDSMHMKEASKNITSLNKNTIEWLDEVNKSLRNNGGCKNA